MKRNYPQLLIKTLRNISMAIASGGILVACGNNYSWRSPYTEIQASQDTSQDPFSIIQKVLKLGKDDLAIAENIDRPQDINPISFRELISYLPNSPQGWTAEKPKGQTSTFGDYTISQVKQRYLQKDKIMTVSIFDWAFNSALYLPFLLSTEFSQESTEGYNKGITIGDIPGRENYDYDTKNGSLNLLINRRFFIQINGDNIEESELREWWEMIDSDSLAQVLND